MNPINPVTCPCDLMSQYVAYLSEAISAAREEAEKQKQQPTKE